MSGSFGLYGQAFLLHTRACRSAFSELGNEAEAELDPMGTSQRTGDVESLAIIRDLT